MIVYLLAYGLSHHWLWLVYHFSFNGNKHIFASYFYHKATHVVVCSIATSTTEMFEIQENFNVFMELLFSYCYFILRHLEDNQFSGEIPSSLGNISSLQEV